MKGGLLRLGPGRPHPTLPADPRQRPATRAASAKLCSLPAGTYNTRATTRLPGRGEALLPFGGVTFPRRCPRPAPLKGAPRRFLDAGFPSESGKPGEHPDLLAF